MAVANTNDLVGTWHGSAVDVGRIEAALTGIWREAGQREAAQGRQLPARTSVLNFVVYGTSAEDASYVAATMAALTGSHPSRTICVLANPEAADSTIDATVSGHIGSSGSLGGRMAWENITIATHGATAAHSPGLVVSLLLPDLPVYLWWVGDPPFGTPLFARLIDLCDRVIVDSAAFSRPLVGLSKLAAIGRTLSGQRGVSDVNWMRLTPWRLLLAQFYDRDELRPYAQRINDVTLQYAVSPTASETHSLTQAILLGGWLASRLGWNPQPQRAQRHNDATTLVAERTGATVELVLQPQAVEGVESGSLLSLTIRASQHDIPAHFSIVWNTQTSEAEATTTIGGQPGPAHTVRLAARNQAELLGEELEVVQHDYIYDDALQTAAALCERIALEETT